MSLIIWHRQDLTTEDNHLLRLAQNSCGNNPKIQPIFIFDPHILALGLIGDRRIGFIIDGLRKLSTDYAKYGITLLVFYGDPVVLFSQLFHQRKPSHLLFNQSYGNGSESRDHRIKKLCDTHRISYITGQQYLLHQPQDVPVRKVFTPFYRLWAALVKPSIYQTDLSQIQQWNGLDTTNMNTIDISDKQYKNSIITLGGAENIYRSIGNIDSYNAFNYSHYEDLRNIPSTNGTSQLSPYTRFGMISIRRLYHHASLMSSPSYISELARREFWQHIAYYFPESLLVEFQEKKRNLTRENNMDYLGLRKAGMTGYPIVDAGMRQLIEMNRMHGRVRMIVASFLTKDLLIDRRHGEQHFHDYLIDYDRNINIGNRQRSASVGADPKPLRIFSPILQAQRFDPQALYIKQWIPELAHIDPVAICDPVKSDLHFLTGGAYPRPIVDHATNSKKAKEMYYRRLEEK